jgi:hypothetical protein
MRFTLLEGRGPDGDDELALGPRTVSVIDAIVEEIPRFRRHTP